MSNILEYKGFIGRVEFSAEDRILHGRIEFINDLVTFEATSYV
jgi:predicted HicB family RNase H-like nuclease